MQANMGKWMAWMKDLSAKGHFKAGEPLDKQGKVVRGRNKDVTDGPYAEAKDVVGGYLVVTAKDLSEAVEMSRGCPIFETNGSVEVRPILQMQT
jgi:hypothetical protein